MSNWLAIATVTAALAQTVRTAVQEAVPGADVVTGRPDGAPGTGTAQRRAHLFLYQVAPNAALSNADLPMRGSDGRLAQRPRAALDLDYLLAFYGDEAQLEPQRMLGAVVRDLHAHPVLTRKAVADAARSQPFLANSNLAEAVELVRLTPVPLTLEELSKLWSVFFQTPYALTVTYRGTVVLIDAEETAPAPLPVLRRGAQDRGVESVIGAFPFLEDVHIGDPGTAGARPRLPSYRRAQLGAVLTLAGQRLAGDEVEIHFAHPRVSTKRVLRPTARTATEIRVTIPDDAAAHSQWAAGLYSLNVMVKLGDNERVTNVMPLPFAPRIASITPPSPVARDAAGSVTLTVQCTPQVRPEQPALLLIGDREVVAQPHAGATDTLRFTIPNAPVVSDTVVWLRVDGMDSLPWRITGTPPVPQFDPAQKVTIT
jgi:hypothetical protein